MRFPLNKTTVTTNSSNTECLENYVDTTEIPIHPHPGAFGAIRKNHQHEGVDLYCNPNENVYAIEEGKIMNILPFTGQIANSPWWNNTYCILIEGVSGVFNYGEILPLPQLERGSMIKEGQLLGQVIPVLKKDKGRPMSMLHLELYLHGTREPITEWNLQQKQPQILLNPTDLLLTMTNNTI